MKRVELKHQRDGHDDQMMGLAIAHEIRTQVVFDEEPIEMRHEYSFNIEKRNDVERDYGEDLQVI